MLDDCGRLVMAVYVEIHIGLRGGYQKSMRGNKR